MDIQPLLNASIYVQVHLLTVMIAIALTFPILLLRKGTTAHRRMGAVWVAAMIATALVSLGIQTFGGFSFIHIFSVMTLISAPMAVWSIRRGKVEAHRNAMLGLVLGGIGIAGAFAFGQGRLMHAVIWGG